MEEKVAAMTTVLYYCLLTLGTVNEVYLVKNYDKMNEIFDLPKVTRCTSSVSMQLDINEHNIHWIEVFFDEWGVKVRLETPDVPEGKLISISGSSGLKL